MTDCIARWLGGDDDAVDDVRDYLDTQPPGAVLLTLEDRYLRPRRAATRQHDRTRRLRRPGPALLAVRAYPGRPGEHADGARDG